MVYMFNTLKITVFIFTFMTASFAYCASWTGPVTITDIYVWDGSFVNVRVASFENPENCSDTQGYMISPSIEAKWFDRMYSQLLAAYTSGKQLSFLLDGCGNKPKIKAISFTQPKT